MKTYKKIIMVFLCIISVSMVEACSVADFDPTQFMVLESQSGDGQQGHWVGNSEQLENNQQNDGQAQINDSLPSICIVNLTDVSTYLDESLSELANIIVEGKPFSNKSNTTKYMAELSLYINELAAMEDYQGIVIINHSTYIEELAYFLDLTVKTTKPVVMVDSESAKTGVVQAVETALQEDSANNGVLVVSAENAVYAINQADSSQKKTFDISSVKNLPNVGIIYQTWPMDIDLLDKTFDQYDGLVIVSDDGILLSETMEFLTDVKNMPMVVRVAADAGENAVRNQGVSDDACGTVAGGNLSISQAKILLMLSLTEKLDLEETQEVFQKNQMVTE